MGRYYVAGIPFDSENSLKHYGVKNMEWGKHKFGIDADDRYIKWLKNAGKNIGKFATNTAQSIAKGATSAANTVGSAVNKGANFVTGNQNRQNAAAKRNEANAYNQKAANPVRSMGYADDTKTARPSQWSDKNAGLTGRDYSQKIADQQRVYASKAAEANKAANEYERRANNAPLPAIKTSAGNAKDAADRFYRESGIKSNVDRLGNAITGETDRQTAEDLRRTADFQSNPNAPFHAIGTQYHPDTLRKEADEYQKRADNALIPSLQRAAGNVRNAIQNPGQTIQDIGNFVTGDQARKDLQDAENSFIFGRQGRVNAAQDAYNQTLPGMVENAGKAVSNAAQDAGNAVSKGAKGFLNSAGQWVSGTVNNVKKAASDAGKGASGFLNSAGQWVSNATGNAKNALQNPGQTIQDIGNFVTGDQARKDLQDAENSFIFGRQGRVNAAQDAYNQTLPGMVENVSRNIGQAAEQARDGIGGFIDRVGDWAGNAAQNAGQAVQNVGDWAGNAVQNAAQAAEQARGGIGGFFDRVGDWGRDAVQNVGGAFQNAGDWIGDRAREAVGNVSGAVQNAAQAAEQARGGIGGFFDRVGDWGRDAAQNVGNWAGQTAQNVGGAVQNAGDWVGDRARDAGNWAGQAAQNVGGAVSGATNAVGDWGRDAAQNAGNWIGDQTRNVGGAVSGAADNVRDWAGQTAQNVGGAVQNAGNWIGNRARDTGNWAGQAAQNIGGAFQNAGDWIGDRARDVSGAVPGAAENVADWARNAAGNVGNWVGQAAQNVGNLVSEMANPHYQLNKQQLLDNYSQYLQDHPENPQSPRHTEWLKEQVQNDPELRAFYEQYMRHSALNDKPAGVSDAFWEKFTAEGGTREEYERDWR